MNNVEQFKNIAQMVIDSAATEKASVFAKKVAGMVIDRGDEWIGKNISLAINEDAAPVADNRAWHLSQWQLALAK